MGPRVTVADIAVLEAWMVANGTDLLEKDSYPARSGSVVTSRIMVATVSRKLRGTGA
jgi:hypothetical protein